MNTSSKFNEKDSRIIAAQLYVAKHLKTSPVKVLKFIEDNRDYFKDIDDKMFNDLMKELKVTKEQMEVAEVIKFPDL